MTVTPVWSNSPCFHRSAQLPGMVRSAGLIVSIFVVFWNGFFWEFCYWNCWNWKWKGGCLRWFFDGLLSLAFCRFCFGLIICKIRSFCTVFIRFFLGRCPVFLGWKILIFCFRVKEDRYSIAGMSTPNVLKLCTHQYSQ